MKNALPGMLSAERSWDPPKGDRTHRTHGTHRRWMMRTKISRKKKERDKDER